MARSIDQQIAALKAVRIGDDGAIDEVRKALRSGRWMLAAPAAKLVAAHRLEELTPELVTAFDTAAATRREIEAVLAG